MRRNPLVFWVGWCAVVAVSACWTPPAELLAQAPAYQRYGPGFGQAPQAEGGSLADPIEPGLREGAIESGQPAMGNAAMGWPAMGQMRGGFRRPYPYHMDYYRMQYGGSYAPYFGNLYGPPRVYAPGYSYPPPQAMPYRGRGGYYW